MAYYRRYRNRYGPTYGRYNRDPSKALVGLAVCLAFITLLASYIMVVGIETTGDVLSVLIGKGAIYDEEVLSEYAEEQYAAIFAESEAIEDHLLIVVLVEPDCKEYHAYARVGAHIAPELAALFNGEDAVFYDAIDDNINAGSYENTLSADLVDTLSRMGREVNAVYDDRLYICEEERENRDALINRSELKLLEGTLRRKIEKNAFSTVILVEDMRDVYGFHLPLKELLIAITTLLAAAGIVLLVIRLFGRSSVGEDTPPEGGRRQKGTDYVEKLDDDHWEERYDRDFSE